MDSKKSKILLIDDEEEFVSTLAERLELRGYSAKITRDGESGISLITQYSFDIVVLDLMMPGLNGLETLKLIKAIDKDLPVIILTGHGASKEGMEGIRFGAFDFLVKPLDIRELINKIQLAINNE